MPYSAYLPEAFNVRRMTVPPNALSAISIWAAAYAASKYKRRAIFIVLAGVVAIIGKRLYVRKY